MSKNKSMIVTVIFVVLLLAAGLAVILNRPDRGSRTDIEQSIRALVPISEEEQSVNSPVLVNSNDALESLKSEGSGDEFRDAQIGDYRVAFDTWVVIYRPSTDQIVNISHKSSPASPQSGAAN